MSLICANNFGSFNWVFVGASRTVWKFLIYDFWWVPRILVLWPMNFGCYNCLEVEFLFKVHGRFLIGFPEVFWPFREVFRFEQLIFWYSKMITFSLYTFVDLFHKTFGIVAWQLIWNILVLLVSIEFNPNFNFCIRGNIRARDT